MENKEIEKFLEEIHINFLKEGQAVWVQTLGKSMEPLIREGDFVKIAPVRIEEINRGDIVAFLRNEKLLIAHRLIKKENKKIFTCGDSFIFTRDLPLEMDNLLGKVIAIRRNKKIINPERGFWYRYGKIITYLRVSGLPLLIIILSLYKFFIQPKLFFIKAVKRVGIIIKHKQIIHQSTLTHGQAEHPYKMKRTADLTGAILGILFLSPLILFLSLLVRLNSKGPAIIKLPRMGKDGKIFNLYKIRSMKNDGEVTSIGKFLRKSFLDELPQFINVFKGEMSLVGPRPEIPSIVEKYNETQRKRLSIGPGLTGLWQISPYRNKPIHEHLEYDFFYIENQSLMLDLKIIFRTIKFCLTRMVANTHLPQLTDKRKLT